MKRRRQNQRRFGRYPLALRVRQAIGSHVEVWLSKSPERDTVLFDRCSAQLSIQGLRTITVGRVGKPLAEGPQKRQLRDNQQSLGIEDKSVVHARRRAEENAAHIALSPCEIFAFLKGSLDDCDIEPRALGCARPDDRYGLRYRT